MSQETRTTETETREPAASSEQEATMVTRSILRIALAVLGFLLLLFALGQAFGLDMLGMFTDFAETWTGQWLLVAVFALILIVIALSGWGRARR